MNWLIPYDRFTLVSVKSASEVAESLGRNTAKPRLFRFRKPPESYSGVVTKEGFKIYPVINYRNSFTPIINGRFYPHHSGTTIKIVQRIHVLVIGLLTLWISMVASIGGLIATSDGSGISEKLFPVGMIVLAWALTTGGFWWEARHTRDELMHILDASGDKSL